MHDRPKRKPVGDANVEAFFRSVYESLSRKVLEEAAEAGPGVHADAESERIAAADAPAVQARAVSKRRARSSR